MKHIKKLSAVLIAVMLISMLSCFAFSASAAGLGGPVSIEKVEAGAGGLVVGGTNPLPANVLVVNSDWAGLRGNQPIKLDGVVYNVVVGTNGFATIGEAVGASNGYDTIYVAAGVYADSVSVNAGGLKIYGPYAGVCPNLGTDVQGIAIANPARPSAAGGDTSGEAVIEGSFSLVKAGSDLTIDGLYFNGGAGFNSALPSAENYRYGTLIQNCVINSTKAQFCSFSSGNHPSFVFKNNRVLKGKSILTIAGMMDAVIENNYLNLSAVTMEMLYITAGSMGTHATIRNNYYENCNGVFTYSNPYQTLLYNVMIRDNYVADMGAAPIVHNTFFARNTLPGTNVQVTGNTFLGMENVTAFEFPYVNSQDNPNRFRHIININENYFDIPAGALLVDSDMNGVLNLANNYYTSPVSVDRVVKYETTDLILFPYYEDADMTVLKGVFLDSDDSHADVNQAERTITFNYYGTDLDCLDMKKALKADAGCTWKLYEDETLITEIKDKVYYFEGTTTERYAKVVGADGVSSAIYKIRVLHDTGVNANLVNLVFDNTQVSSATIEGNNFTYNFPADLAFAEYDVKVSAGATYELYKSYSQAKPAESEAFPEIGSYIPYGGFEFDIVVTAEDGGANDPEKKIYHVTFNRAKSDYYDPSIVGVNAPEGGRFETRKDALNPGTLRATYYCPYLLNAATFDLATTPGASYVIYEDAALTKELSSSANKKEIKLADGVSTLYVKVADENGSNVIPFTIENVKKSSDAIITGLTGLSARINNNEISIQSGGANVSVSFITRNKYATVKVFADAAKKVEVAYNSSPVEDRDHPNQIIDERSFALDIAHATSYYYVVCTAEDGTTRDYKLVITKLAQDKVYDDVTDDDWFYKCVTNATNAGILQGSKYNNSNIFRPADNTTRQEMAIIASRLLGINCGAFEKITLPYKDTASIADWALGYVKVAYKMNIMKGDGANFNPNASITREEAMAMFARMYNLTGSADLTQFADHAQIAAWAKPEIEAVVATGLVQGDNGNLKPKAAITRAEIAAIIDRI